MNNIQANTAVAKKASTLAGDFEDVVNDAQELLETMGDQGSAKVADIKKRAQASIDDARKHLVELRASVTDCAKSAAKNADQYVRDNPWSTMAMIAGLGIVVGYLAARRQPS